jgi:hypothetical protein
MLPALIEEHLVANRPATSIPYRLLPGAHIFVCTHRRRDERCGACGPPLFAALQQELAAQGLHDKVSLYQSSHVGGHALAGNVLVYPGGDWYGYVAPGDAPRLVERHLKRGEILADLWRGRMGLTAEEQLAHAEATYGGC